MMNPSSVDIADMLASSGLGLVLATNLFVGKEPATPSDCVTIFDTPGKAQDKYFDNTVKYYRPSVQVRVRNTSYLQAWEMMHDIRERLHSAEQSVWSGTHYSAIFCSIEPALLDWDTNNRARFVATFEIQRY